MHDSAKAFCKEMAETYGGMGFGLDIDGGMGFGLDIGGRDVNGQVRDFWPNMSWTIVDLIKPTGTEDCTDYIIADYSVYNFGDTKFNLVLCTEVFEHTDQWYSMVRNSYRDLVTPGLFIATCAGPGRPPHNAFDGSALREGEYYWNIEPGDMAWALMAVGYVKGEVRYDFGESDLYVVGLKG